MNWKTVQRFLLALVSNKTSLFGTAIASGTAILIVTFIFMETIGAFHGGPYAGIITFLLLPAVFIGGLMLVPVGLLRDRRRRQQEAGTSADIPFLPVVNLNSRQTRYIVITFLIVTMMNIGIFLVAAYKSVELADSTEFCGTTCHTVMRPEYTAYQRSPHARVKCVECHIGPGASWFVKSKLSGSWQVIAVAFNLYPRPISAPVEALRPSRDTCEHCHWPEKFVGDKLKIITHFDNDEKNTEKKTVLLMHIGGNTAGTMRGIHWHVDKQHTLRYRSDAKRENMYQVELSNADGTVEDFLLDGKKPDETKAGEWRTMDCIDCHNRPTHIYRTPEWELDHAMVMKHLDTSLPFLRREALRLLKEKYPSQEAAKAAIRDGLLKFYSDSYPDLTKSSHDKLLAVARDIGTMYTNNVYPEMNIAWGTYPNHLGHEDSPGCSRCHDGSHKTVDGKTIPDDCELCHAALANDEADPPVLKLLRP